MGLTLHDESDAPPPGGDWVMLWINEGTNYRVRVTGFSSESGPFTLDWFKVPPPANDSFANPQVIAGIEVEGDISGNNVGATLEPGEPATTAGWEAGGSVWFSWEAPATGTFSLRLRAEWDTQLAIFTGEEVGALTVLDESDPQDGEGDAVVTLAAEDGASYRVRVSGFSLHRGSFTLDWSILPVFQKMYTFEASAGRRPLGCLVQGVDGNFYGATAIGGATDNGTLFKMTPDGVMTTLVEFSAKGGPNKGGAFGGVTLVQCRDGEFYGTTGITGEIPGTIFKVTPEGVFTTLVEFAGGENPISALVQGSDGDFYGTTNDSDENDHGTVFKMTPAGVLTTLLEFTGAEGPNLGSSPETAVVQGSDGNFYGTTSFGGADDQGTIFKMTPAGVLTTLFEFGGSEGDNNGSNPQAALVQGNDGDFYGTTYVGGIGYGTVFRITPAGVLTTLVEFTGTEGPNLGSPGSAAMVLGSDGNFYGTTDFGGADDKGTVFTMTPEGVLTTLVEFSGNGATDVGTFPRGALVLGSGGDFYGTTDFGGFGSNDVGTVFKVTPEGALTTLVDFATRGGGGVGASPAAALVLGSDGNFYGTTVFDGATDSGTVFKMTPAGVATRLVEFTGTMGPKLGQSPRAALVQGSDGAFYGTTYLGGANDSGTVFKMTPAGVLTTLVEFGRSETEENGKEPSAALVQGSDGNFYGTTYLGGATNHGTVFKITP
ncbi:MAG: choice-of-anchor tandem repeat GloVer-containing protein, partial [Akkermansiaceae bacterium]